MNKALLVALASVALVGASCSVQDFAPVVLDKPMISASFDLEAPKAEITTMDELEDYYGKYSFRYGYLSENRYDSNSFPLYPRATFLTTDGSFMPSDKHVTNVGFIPAIANTTYSLYYSVLNYANVYFYDASYTFLTFNNAISNGSSFSTPANTAFLKFEFRYVDTRDLPFGFDVSSLNVDLRLGTGTYNGYQPYAVGMSYETPLSGARTAAYGFDAYGDIQSRLVYTDSAYPELRDFELYFDSLHWMLDNDTYEAFNVSLSEALADATMRNIDGFDYDRDGMYEVMWTVENPYDAYLEFEIGSPLPDRYKDTMIDGLESLYYKLDDGTTTATGYLTPSSALFDALDGLLINGLLDVQGFKDWLIDRQSVTFSGGVSMNLNFNYGLIGKELGAAPVYVDNRSYASTNDLALMPVVSASAVINLGNHWVCFSLDLNTTYAGNATSYNGEFAMVGDKTYYRDLSIFTPRNQSANELRYVGVLSSYARGYADGVASRDGEVDDLTERILSLEEDLTQYQGKSYQQIYDLGKQAGMNLATNAGAATFNSLFGNILTAPLTILNGLMPMEFFGMPILTAILSLLMVAMALFLFKRFK